MQKRYSIAQEEMHLREKQGKERINDQLREIDAMIQELDLLKS